MPPVTRYVAVDGSRVAYQVFGEGAVDIVVSAGSFSHTDVIWEDPAASLFYTRLASFARVIRYDRLGTSNSDPLPPGWGCDLDSFGHELEAVLDAVDASNVVLVAMLDAGPFAIHYAAVAPERVRALILYNTTARFLRDDDYEFGRPQRELDDLLGLLDEAWGTEAQVGMNVPSQLGDERFAAWYAKFVRSLGTPTAIIGILREHVTLDARPSLSELRIPTLVLHRAGYGLLPLEHGRYLAANIPAAEFAEIPGSDGPMFWESPDVILAHIRDFVAGGQHSGAVATEVATVLFTDIVRSTELAGSLGDEEWTTVVGAHEAAATAVVEIGGGRVIKGTGDGILAIFPDPAMAIACAERLRTDSRAMGLSVRVGLHTGRIVATSDEVRGLAVHLAARVMSVAERDQIVVSRTVRDLMLGSEYRFVDLGPHTLKGIEGTWNLYQLGT